MMVVKDFLRARFSMPTAPTRHENGGAVCSSMSTERDQADYTGKRSVLATALACKIMQLPLSVCFHSELSDLRPFACVW